MPPMGLPLRCGDTPTREKGSHLPARTTKLGKLRDGRDSTTAPTAEPDWDSPLSKEGAEVLSPPRDTRNVTVLHRGLAQVH